MSSKIEVNVVRGSLLCAFCNKRELVALRIVNVTGNQHILCLECAGAVSTFYKSFDTEPENGK